MDRSHEEALWAFACALYQQPKVKPILLGWQRRYDMHVNIVLFCVWAGVKGWRKLSAAQMQGLIEAVELWHDHIVCGLREMRQMASQHQASAAMVDDLLAEELHAERIEQALLLHRAMFYRRARPGSQRQQLQRACQHIKAYFIALGVRMGCRNHEGCVAVLHAHFDQLTAEQVHAVCVAEWQSIENHRPRQMALSLSNKKHRVD